MTYQRSVVEGEPVALVPVAQLRAVDVPDLRCPTGTDLMQVLWCPNVHGGAGYAGPAVCLRWRASAGLVDVAEPPPGVRGEDRLLPRACTLCPEQVIEYPWWQELPPELGRRVRQWDDGRVMGEETYFSTSQAPGWKVGGYANWEVTDLLDMSCGDCGRPMDLLLTIDSTESDGGAWRPEQERHLTPPPSTVDRFLDASAQVGGRGLAPRRPDPAPCRRSGSVRRG